MSKFCDKCDFADHIDIFGLENTLKANIYIGDSGTPLNATCYKDLVPYLAHIVGASVGGKDGCTYIRLTARPWLDYQEEDRLESYKKSMVTYYNSCKRKKVEFDIDTACKRVTIFDNDETTRELARRVKEKGNKAELNGLHFRIYDMYRQNLVDEMIKEGIDPCDYGYERFINSKA